MNSETLKTGFSAALAAAILYAIFVAAAIKFTPHRAIQFAPLLANAATFGAAAFVIALAVKRISTTFLDQD